MSGRILWKLILVALVALWAGSNLIPLEDKPFEPFIETRATANHEDYAALLEKARARVEAQESPSLKQAIADVATLDKVDLNATFFPDVHLVQVPTLKKRNEVMMDVLQRHSKGRLKKGLDLSGGIGFTLKVGDKALEGKNDYQLTEQLNQVISIMRDRVNAFGVAEPILRPVGKDAVEVQLPGEFNADSVKELNKPARLEFRMVHRTKTPPADAIPGSMEYLDGKMYEVLVQEIADEQTQEIVEVKHYIERLPLATGKILDHAFPSMTGFGGYQINMEFTSEGSDVFADLTRKIAEGNRGGNVGRMAIVLDGKLYSAPTVREEIRGGGAMISGSFTLLEAQELSNVLNNPLEVPLEVAQMYEVSPTLAKDARISSIEAAALGAGLVVLFMLAFYRAAGVVSVLTICVNVFIVLGIMASLNATLTLPGVAALVLTIGMAVDANILIFERIREELRDGKRMETALEGGFAKAFSTIVDANVTTLITASILIWLGTGPVKGFGVMLAIGIGATVFCSLILSRALLEILLSMGLTGMLRANKQPGAIEFQTYRKPAFITSWIVVVCGVVALWQVGHKAYGIDFLGGEEVSVSYTQEIPVEQITQFAENSEFGEVIPTYQKMIGDDALSVLKLQTETGKGTSFLKTLKENFPDAGLEHLGTNQIGATVSSDITTNAIVSVVVALAGILLYIAVRFEFGYGIGAVVATIHDVLMTIGLFIICGQFLGLGSGQFTAPMVAAILMIVGYSINDTIVVFDRIREELELNPGTNLFKVVNLAINRTLTRTILTSITTLLAAVALFIFGAGVITDYALVFIIGIFTGTFSSIFIASPVFYWWHKGDRRHVEEREFLPKYDWETGAK